MLVRLHHTQPPKLPFKPPNHNPILRLSSRRPFGHPDKRHWHQGPPRRRLGCDADGQGGRAGRAGRSLGRQSGSSWFVLLGVLCQGGPWAGSGGKHTLPRLDTHAPPPPCHHPVHHAGAAAVAFDCTSAGDAAFTCTGALELASPFDCLNTPLVVSAAVLAGPRGDGQKCNAAEGKGTTDACQQCAVWL